MSGQTPAPTHPRSNTVPSQTTSESVSSSTPGSTTRDPPPAVSSTSPASPRTGQPRLLHLQRRRRRVWAHHVHYLFGWLSTVSTNPIETLNLKPNCDPLQLSCTHKSAITLATEPIMPATLPMLEISAPKSVLSVAAGCSLWLATIARQFSAIRPLVALVFQG